MVFSRLFTCRRRNLTCMMYRHIQLLTNLCNEVHQKYLLSSMIVTSILILSCSLVPLVQIPISSDNAPVLCMLLGACLDSLFYELFCLGGMVTVHKKSKIFIRKLKLEACIVSESVGNGRWTRKFARSCAPIKIKFGSNNFIEELTPLKCLTCSLRLTVQILLVARKG